MDILLTAKRRVNSHEYRSTVDISREKNRVVFTIPCLAAYSAEKSAISCRLLGKKKKNSLNGIIAEEEFFVIETQRNTYPLIQLSISCLRIIERLKIMQYRKNEKLLIYTYLKLSILAALKPSFQLNFQQMIVALTYHMQEVRTQAYTCKLLMSMNFDL